MATAATYLIRRFFYRIWDFLVHWYYHGFLFIGGQAVKMLESLDKTLALRITLRYFGKPLYQDYTIIGYIFGLVFRSIRIIIGIVTYAVVAAAFLALYVIWAGIPIYIMAQIR